MRLRWPARTGPGSNPGDDGARGDIPCRRAGNDEALEGSEVAGRAAA